MTGPATVRDAVAGDAAAIKDVGHRTWPSTYAFAGQDHIANGLATWWSTEAVERGLATTVTKVAEVAGQVVGMGNLDLRRDPAVIWKLYVVPEAQGSGAGSALMSALIGALPEDRDRVCLEYLEGNDRAAGFYARRGFAVTDRVPSRVPGEPDQVWATWRR